MRSIAVLLLCLLLPAAALADNVTKQFENGEAVSLRPDMAYVLYREIVHKSEHGYPHGLVFVRGLSADELRAVIERHAKDPDAKEPPNVFRTDLSVAYVDGEEERIYLAALPPGTYVLAGEGFSAAMGTCMCMGTVKFDAKPGVLTDLGFVLAARDDKPTTIPELAAIVHGKDMDYDPVLIRMAVRPPTPDLAVPPQLAALPRVLADYRAQDRFPNYFGGTIDRLAPIAGVLGYDKDGHVLDLMSAPPK
jgi:hypothetical protein